MKLIARLYAANQDSGVEITSWANGCDLCTVMFVAATALHEVKRMFKDQPELFPAITELALKIDKEKKDD